MSRSVCRPIVITEQTRGQSIDSAAFCPAFGAGAMREAQILSSQSAALTDFRLMILQRKA